MRYRFEIDSNNAISIWDEENPNELGAPFLFQPSWPTGQKWADLNEATIWAELLIESLINEESVLIPGESPAEPAKPRPIIQVPPTEEENA